MECVSLAVEWASAALIAAVMAGLLYLLLEKRR